ncbi:MAG: tryptophan--tRNA ligase [Parcubacteria group bacterium]|nr:tryptophan--tRNA ligase [Parcubacteria group bacterium]
MTRILSGIRPSGKLHLGNYLGAIKNWIELQDKNPELCIFMIVDYHGITTPFDPKNYGEQIFDTACEFLAAGIDPEKSLLIRQSQMPQHTELSWIFNSITPVSWLDRLPTYKEQLEKTKVNNMGLLDYPVLMAADILIYKANLVPVGQDQLPHIDLANEILKKFNSMFGQTFEPIKAYLAPGSRIMSLQDPEKKMSKTGDEGIALTDSPDEIRKKIKKAVTDSGKEIKFDEKGKPAISNLMTIYALLDPSIKNLRQIEEKYEGKTYVDFKNDLTEVIIGFLSPFQKKYNELKNNVGEVEKILADSEEKARNEAQKTLDEVKQKIGVLPR